MDRQNETTSSEEEVVCWEIVRERLNKVPLLRERLRAKPKVKLWGEMFHFFQHTPLIINVKCGAHAPRRCRLLRHPVYRCQR